MRRYRITADGRVLGDLYGVILESWPSCHLAIEGETIRAKGPVPDAKAFETLVLDEIQGSFVAVTHTGLPRRLYPDCGSTVAVVYCPQTRRIGSSAALVLDDEAYWGRLNRERHARLILREGMGSWIPGALTAHDGVFRLLDNHYLDLETWRPVRYWPRREDFSQDMSIEEGVETITTGLQRFMACAASEFRVGITLTAGFDSRILLAAARSVVDRVEFFNITPGRPGLDQIVSSRIARELHLPFRTVRAVPASSAQRDLWDHAVGHAVREGNRESYPTLYGLGYDVILTGLFGEPGRSRLYRPDFDTINRKTLNVAMILSRLGRPQDAELIANIEPWLAQLDWLPSSAVLDLAHMELKGSSWAMAQHPAQCAAQLELNPIAQRAIRRAFLSVPPEAKGTEALFRASIMMMWPELMSYPINKLGTYHDHLRHIGKVFDPSRVRRYLRARLAAARTG